MINPLNRTSLFSYLSSKNQGYYFLVEHQSLALSIPFLNKSKLSWPRKHPMDVIGSQPKGTRLTEKEELALFENYKGITPILGCQFNLKSRQNGADSFRLSGYHFPQVLLIAKDKEGYSNLVQLRNRLLWSDKHQEWFVDRNILSRYTKGLFCLLGTSDGEACKWLLKGQYDKVDLLFTYFQGLFGKQNVFLNIQENKERNQTKITVELQQYLQQSKANVKVKLICARSYNFFDYKNGAFYSEREMDSMFVSPGIVFDKAKANVIRNMNEIKKACTYNLQGFHIPHVLNVTENASKNLLYRLKQQPENKLFERELEFIQQINLCNYVYFMSEFYKKLVENKVKHEFHPTSIYNSPVLVALGLKPNKSKTYRTKKSFLNSDSVAVPEFEIKIHANNQAKVIQILTELLGENKLAIPHNELNDPKKELSLLLCDVDMRGVVPIKGKTKAGVHITELDSKSSIDLGVFKFKLKFEDIA